MAKTPKSPAAADAPAKRARKAKAPAAAKAPKAAKAAPAPITGPVDGGVMKARTLLERVAARAGVSRAVAKPVLDAALAELGESIARGEGFVLPPLGKAKLGKSKEGAGGATQIVIKLKQGGAKKEAENPLEPEAE